MPKTIHINTSVTTARFPILLYAAPVQHPPQTLKSNSTTQPTAPTQLSGARTGNQARERPGTGRTVHCCRPQPLPVPHVEGPRNVCGDRRIDPPQSRTASLAMKCVKCPPMRTSQIRMPAWDLRARRDRFPMLPDELASRRLDLTSLSLRGCRSCLGPTADSPLMTAELARPTC